MVSHLGALDSKTVPLSAGGLIATLMESRIDWNSCRIEENRILDGWGFPISAAFHETTATWTFRSSGRDGKFGTIDDIEEKTLRKP